MTLLEQFQNNAFGLSLEQIFGPNYKTAINFLLYVEKLNYRQIDFYNILRERDSRRFDHYNTLTSLYLAVTSEQFRDSIFYHADYPRNTQTFMRGSLLEIILLDKLLEKKIELFYLPLFEQL